MDIFCSAQNFDSHEIHVPEDKSLIKFTLTVFFFDRSSSMLTSLFTTILEDVLTQLWILGKIILH